MVKIGFVGIGIMGRAMVANLLKANSDVTVHDISIERVNELVALGAKAGISPQDIAKQTEVIITMLPTNQIVKETIDGENGIYSGAKKGTVVIDMSSSSPTMIQQLAKQGLEKGITLLDAPVSGGEPKAIDSTLAIMVGGDENAFNKVKDILLLMGSSVTYVGPSGSGDYVKLANQIIVALNIAAMSEAVVFAAKAGINPESVYNAIHSGLAGSTVFDQKMPKILERDFNPGARLDIHIKDLVNALEASHNIDAYLPLTSQVLEYMYALKSDGKGNIDHGGLIQFYEKISNVIVEKK